MAGIQLGGLASGMDTETVIAQLMQLEAQPATRMTQSKRISEAREQALKDILSRVKNLQTAARDLKSVTTWADTQTVESSDAAKISATRVGGAGPGGYSISVSKLASGDQWSFDYTKPASDTTLTIRDTATPTPNVIQTIALKADVSIDDAVLQINSDPNGKVYAVKVGDKLALSSRTTGDAAAFTVDADPALTNGVRTRVADNAEYSLDGGVTTKESASNVVKDGIAGIEFTIKTLVPTSSPVTLNVSNPGADTAGVKDKIKKFVEQYNSTLDLIRSKLTEERVKDPKTDADRAKGALRNDSMLNGIVRQLRDTIGAAFDTGTASLDQLAEIGISTGSATAKTSADALAGKLVIDETKLNAALSTSPLTVRKLLGGSADVEGIGTRLDSMLDAYAKSDGDIDKRIESADKEQKRYDDQIANLNRRIEAKATMLRAQFAAMESAISRSQQQQSWLVAQLG